MIVIRKPIPHLIRLGLGLFSVTLLLFAYTLLAQSRRAINKNDTTIPMWSEFRVALKQICTVEPDEYELWERVGKENGVKRPRPLLWTDATATFGRLGKGLVLSVALSVVLGLLMGCSRFFEAFILPPLVFLAKVPPTAILPIFFVVVGTDIKYFLAVIAFGIVPTMSQSIWLACREIPTEYFFKAFSLGAGNWAAVRRIMFPFAKPKILDAIRLSLGPAVVYLIAAEWLVSEDGTGFGYTIRVLGPKVNWAVPYLYVAILAAFTFLIDFGLKRLQMRMCSWYVRDE